MALPPSLPRSRTVALLVAFIGCLSLVLLPLVGLNRIDDTTERSHRYTQIVTTADRLGTRLLQLVTGALARYGTEPTEDNRSAALAELEAARKDLAELQALRTDARRLDMDPAVDAYIRAAAPTLDASDAFVAEIAGGETLASAPSRDSLVTAAGALLQAQGEFALAISPIRVELDEQSRDAVSAGHALLVGAVAVALVTVGVLMFLDTRRIETLFQQQEEEKESAERLAAQRADVVSMASHELRTPLTVLTLSTSMLRSSAAQRHDSELNELANDAHTAALRCEALVSELLDLGRIDADRLNLKLGATPLLPALHDAVRLSEATHGSHPLLISGADEVRVNADPDRLRVILRNLIDNAFKYSPIGSDVRVDVQQWEGRVRIDVRDRGTGVPEDERDRIFQRFHRLSTTEHLPGVGIGLYLSRELARRMDGDLRCAPSEAGATFELDLPRAV